MEQHIEAEDSDENPFSFSKFTQKTIEQKVCDIDLSNKSENEIEKSIESSFPSEEEPSTDSNPFSFKHYISNTSKSGGSDELNIPTIQDSETHGDFFKPVSKLNNNLPDINSLELSESEGSENNAQLKLQHADTCFDSGTIDSSILSSNGEEAFAESAAVDEYSFNLLTPDDELSKHLFLSDDFCFKDNKSNKKLSKDDLFKEIQKLQKENTKLKSSLTAAQQTIIVKQDRITEAEEQIKAIENREKEEMSALEKLVARVESNLLKTKKQMAVSEEKVSKLEQENASLKARLSANSLSTKNSHMRETADLLSTQLTNAADMADQHIKQLLSGVTNLRQISDMLAHLPSFDDSKIHNIDFDEAKN